eukprot:GCRY01007461.1.p1 GENE.GCRY01007461.1~~GCRY01007461.1.p1  ORF type:complete len:247 (-),score=38.70 GCRY01007461.1:578-1318(-)
MYAFWPSQFFYEMPQFLPLLPLTLLSLTLISLFLFALTLFSLFVGITQISRLHVGKAHHIRAVILLSRALELHPSRFCVHLTAAVSALLRGLDPNMKRLREACLPAISHTLKIMVNTYPQIDFHQDSQLLAVCNRDPDITLFDVKSATVAHVLAGHKHSVAALAFSPSGAKLASFSSLSGGVILWKKHSSFLGLLGDKFKCDGFFSTVGHPNAPPLGALEDVKLQWLNEHTITLSHKEKICQLALN